MWQKIQDYLKDKNYSGLFIPFVSDPKTKSASVTLSLMIVSFVFVCISLFTKKIDNSGAFEVFLATAGLYLGRKITNKNSTIEEVKPKTKA